MAARPSGWTGMDGSAVTLAAAATVAAAADVANVPVRAARMAGVAAAAPVVDLTSGGWRSGRRGEGGAGR